MTNRAELPAGPADPAATLRGRAAWLVVPSLAAVFVWDVLFPLGVAHGLLYAPVLLVAVAGRRRGLLLWSCAAALVLIAAGTLISAPPPGHVTVSQVVANRLLSALVVLCIGGLGDRMLRWIDGLEKALRELSESRALLEVAGNVGRLGGWSVPIPGDRVVWSAEVERIHGVEPGETIDVEKALAFYHPEDREHIRREFERCVRDGTPYDSEYRVVPRGGRQVWVRSTGRAVRDRSGRIIAVEGALQDISRIKLAEESAEESERRLRIAADLMPIPVWTAAPDGTVDFVNRAMEDHAGMPARLLARDWQSTLHPDDLAACEEAWARAVAEGTPYSIEARVRRADGEFRWHLLRALPIRDTAGAIAKWHGTAVDLHERRELEEREHEVSRRLEATLESITDAFFTLDRDWRFTYLNRRAEELLLRRREELLGRHVWEEFAEALGTLFQEKYEHAASSGESVTFEDFYPPLATWFSVSAYPSEQGLAVYFRDVTEARRRDEQLRLLEAAVSRLNDLVVITEADPVVEPGPRIVYVNDAFERRTGYPRSEVIGRSPCFLQGPDTDRETLDRIRAALVARQPVREEVLNYTKDGTPYWLELDIVPLADERGRHTHFVAVERDVTGRKRSEEELKASQQRLELLLNSIMEGVHGLDAEGNILFENPASQALLGWSIGEMAGRHAHTLMHHHRRDGRPYPAEECPVYHTLRDGVPRRVVDEVFFRRDGSSFPVEYHCAPMRDSAGAITGVVVTFRDVTRENALEEQLRESQRLESIGKLTGGMAHDFNNLLTVIQGNAELLADELVEEPHLCEFADLIRAAAERGADLTHRLLAFARRQPLDPRPVDVPRLVEELEPLLRRAVGDTVVIRLAPQPGLRQAMVDRSQLESALMNLSINARDAMPGGGTLTIGMANASIDEEFAKVHPDVAPGRYVLLTVADTGSGMTPEVLERVFEPFFTTKPAGKGTGLGLSMVYGFIKQSRGHIRVDSRVGVGTEISLYLPQADDRAHTPVPEQEAERPRTGNAVVLLVEDDPLVRSCADAQLRSLGYEVHVAEHAAAALEVLGSRDDIDLLFTDVLMPGGMNGRQLADAARLMRPGLRVLYTSGYTDGEILHEGRLEIGAHLLGKPYGRAELARKIREVLDPQN